MKKLIAVALAALSLSSFAAWEKVGTLQVANMSEIGTAATKIGTFVGNPMASAMIAGALADMPMIKFFGPMREGQAMVLTLFVDAKMLGEAPASALETPEYAILYPMSKTKEEFLAMHKGAVEEDGFIVIKESAVGDDDDVDDEDEEDDEDVEITYVRFSKDGKWAAASDKKSQVPQALEDIAIAVKAMDGDVARLRIGEKAMKAIVASAAKEEKADPNVIELLKSVAGCTCGVRVSDRGVDFRGFVKPVAGSELSKSCLIPLGADPLAFAGKSAVFATAQAENVSSAGEQVKANWARVTELLKKHGIDLARFMTMKSDAGKDTFSIKVAEIAKVAQAGGATNEFTKLDVEALIKDVQELPSDKFTAKGPAYAQVVELEGFESQWSVQERFAATLPEAAGKKPAHVTFFSLSSVLKAAFQQALAATPEEQRAALKPVFDQMGAETKCGIAGMSWAEKDKGALRFFCRIAGDEFKVVGNASGALMMMAMTGGTGMMQAGPSSFDDDDEDDDED